MRRGEENNRNWIEVDFETLLISGDKRPLGWDSDKQIIKSILG
jgi:hypothetical protein